MSVLGNPYLVTAKMFNIISMHCVDVKAMSLMRSGASSSKSAVQLTEEVKLDLLADNPRSNCPSCLTAKDTDNLVLFAGVGKSNDSYKMKNITYYMTHCVTLYNSLYYTVNKYEIHHNNYKRYNCVVDNKQLVKLHRLFYGKILPCLMYIHVLTSHEVQSLHFYSRVTSFLTSFL